MLYLGIFGLEFEKAIVAFEINALKSFRLQSLVRKKNSGQKMPNLSILDQKCLVWVFLGHSFKKAIVIFKISTVEFVQLQNIVK